MKDASNRKFRFCAFGALGLVAVVVLAALATLVVYGVWNSVLHDVLGVKPVTYWQALGLLVLAKLLFGGFPCRGGGGCGPRWRRRRMMKRWESLTPEERERMREEMRRRFGDWPYPCCGDEPDEKAKP